MFLTTRYKEYESINCVDSQEKYKQTSCDSQTQIETLNTEK